MKCCTHKATCALLYGYFRHFHGLISTIRDFALGGTQEPNMLQKTESYQTYTLKVLRVPSHLFPRQADISVSGPASFPFYTGPGIGGPQEQRTGVPTHSFSPSPLLPSHQNDWLGYLKRGADYYYFLTCE